MVVVISNQLGGSRFLGWERQRTFRLTSVTEGLLSAIVGLVMHNGLNSIPITGTVSTHRS